jgi:hypothetical protein
MPTDQMVTAEAQFFADRLLQEAIDAPPRPAIIPDGDTARTRRTDPQTSHDAADRSQATLHATRAAVLRLVSIHGSLTGSQLNEQYSLLATRNDWPKVHFDSPRRRAGELAKDGLLDVSDVPRGTERAYTLTDAGRKAVQA